MMHILHRPPKGRAGHRAGVEGKKLTQRQRDSFVYLGVIAIVIDKPVNDPIITRYETAYGRGIIGSRQYSESWFQGPPQHSLGWCVLQCKWWKLVYGPFLLKLLVTVKIMYKKKVFQMCNKCCQGCSGEH